MLRTSAVDFPRRGGAAQAACLIAHRRNRCVVERGIRGNYSRNFALFTDGNDLFHSVDDRSGAIFTTIGLALLLVRIANRSKQLRKRGRFLQLT